MTHLTGDYWGVEMPAKAERLEISIQPDNIPCITYWYGENLDPTVISLPPGQWEIVVLAKDITEEIAKGVVDKFNNGTFRDHSYKYFDPSEDTLPMFLTALESFQSLLKSKNLNPSQTLIIKKIA